MEIPRDFGISWIITGNRTAPATTFEGGFQVLTFRDLPAQDTEPWILSSVEGKPVLTVYFQPFSTADYRTDADYWSKGVSVYFKNNFQDYVERGKAFYAFAKEVTQGLDGLDPQAKAVAIYDRLQKAWLNLDRLSEEEKTKRPKEYASDPIKPSDLETAAKHRETNSFGMRVAFFNILETQDIYPHLAGVPDRARRIFNPGIHNFYQLDGILVGIKAPGKPTLWMDPAMRFADPGLVHPAYQGVPGLEYDGLSWAAVNLKVPVQPPEFNRSTFEYWIVVGEEADQVRAKGMYTGFPGWSQRLDFLPLEPAQQSRKLKERAEKAVPGLKVEKAEVANVFACVAPFGWEVAGSMDREEVRRRAVVPFPGMELPVELPDLLPEKRVYSIFMPYLRTQTALCHLKVPAAYKVYPSAPFTRTTGFGDVSWSADCVEGENGTEVTVRLATTLSHFSALPTAYPDLKRFLAAMKEACGLTIVLEKR